MQVFGSQCSIKASCRSSRPATAAVPQQQPCQLTRRQVRLAAAAEAGSTTTKSISPFAATTTVSPAAATASPTAASTTSTPERTEAWGACMQRLQDMGFSEQQAELSVQRAFGWGPKARSYWRHEKSEQPADLQQLDAALEFLRQLGSGMSEEQVFRVVKSFPEVLGCDVQQQLQGNVNKLQKDWNLQGNVLVKAVLRQPAVLGYNLDCMGDCAGECNRCWARF